MDDGHYMPASSSSSGLLLDTSIMSYFSRELEVCSKEELVSLVRELGREKTELRNQIEILIISVRRRSYHPPSSSSSASNHHPPTEAHRGKIIGKLARKSTSAIRKTLHSAAKKPHTHTVSGNSNDDREYRRHYHHNQTHYNM
jgi:hypothetical protein